MRSWKLRKLDWRPMRLLLDECVPARLRRLLPSHEVSTVVAEGWSGVKNGELLSRAATKFDAFITVDKNMPYQQDVASLPLAVFVLDALSNEVPYLLPLLPSLERKLTSLVKGGFVVVTADG